jgi:hypothetical protein
MKLWHVYVGLSFPYTINITQLIELRRANQDHRFLPPVPGNRLRYGIKLMWLNQVLLLNHLQYLRPFPSRHSNRALSP